MADAQVVALVGTGDIGRIHATALAEQPDVELRVVTGRRPTIAGELAAALGVPLVDDLDAALADPAITAVDLCVPNHLHAELAVRALAAGKHVLLEKPVALTLTDAVAIREQAAASGRTVMVGTTLRYWECYSAARDRILTGELGPVHGFTARRMLSLLRAVQGAEGWRQSGERSGGAILDLQIHDIDFALWTFGLPEQVFSRGTTSATGAIDHVWTLLRYPELTVSLEASFLLQGGPVIMDFRALGTDASLDFSFVQSDFAMHQMSGPGTDDTGHTGSLVERRWGHEPHVLATDPADPVAAAFSHEIGAFVDFLRTGDTDGLPSVDQAIDALRVALATRESVTSGSTVSLER